MSASNSRKRAAPGAEPTIPQPPRSQQPSTQMQSPYNNQSSDSLIRWNPGDSMSFALPSSPYNFSPSTQAAQAQALPSASTSLARRQNHQALIPTSSFAQSYDQSDDKWSFGDDSSLVPHLGEEDQQGADNIEALEEMAQKAKRDALGKRKSIPPFVQKLSSFLEENKNEELIHWSEAGDSFVVEDEDEFAKTLIPELFKHNNYASFVRQLNMYGFHKRVGLSDNSMRASERKNKSPSEYSNPNFRRGHPNLLWLINKPKSKNKKGGSKYEEGEGDSDEEAGPPETFKSGPSAASLNIPTGRSLPAPPDTTGTTLPKQELAMIQEELVRVKKQQSMILGQFHRIQKNNNDLYKQAMKFQSQHERHQNSINAILSFLANVFRKTLEDQGSSQNVNDIISSLISNQAGVAQQASSQVVDLGDFFQGQPDHTTGMGGTHKRARGLLPPASGYSAFNQPHSSSTTDNAPFQPFGHQNPEMGHITELSEYSPADTPPNLRQELETNPQERMMKIINDHNATNTSGMQLPDAEKLVANTPGSLNNDQRSKIINMMTGSDENSPPNTNPSASAVSPRRLSFQNTNVNAFPDGHASAATPSLSPIMRSPPISPPSLNQISAHNDEMNRLLQLQRQQDSKINELGERLGPLSPSGQIPGLDGNDPYFNSQSQIDFDQFLNNAAFLDDDDGNGGDGDFDFSFGAGDKAAADMNVFNQNQNNTPSPAGTEEIPRYDLEANANSSKRRRV